MENCKRIMKSQGELIIFLDETVSLSNLIKRPNYLKSIDYSVVCSENMKDGDSFTIKLGNWSHEDTYWSPAYLQKALEEKGFKTSVEYLSKKFISSEYYTDEEQNEIDGAKCIFALRAKAPLIL